jgi:hypothetical protein
MTAQMTRLEKFDAPTNYMINLLPYYLDRRVVTDAFDRSTDLPSLAANLKIAFRAIAAVSPDEVNLSALERVDWLRVAKSF